MDWLAALIAALGTWLSSDDLRWADVLGEIDEVRAEAFATGQEELLDQVYVPGSPGRDVDAALIGAYERRGGHVVGADLEVLWCKVVRVATDRISLDVVDRLAETKVVWADGTSRALPRDLPTRRVVTLVRTPDGWRIAD